MINLEKLDTQAIKHHYNQQQRADAYATARVLRRVRQDRQESNITISDEAERYVAAVAKQMGYSARLTPATYPYDVDVFDSAGRLARVEVKISTIQPNGRGHRYQARIHHHHADLVIFIARNGSDWPYVIPMAAIAPRHNIAISSRCPGTYSGQWACYLEAWQHLRQAVENALPRPVQLNLVAH